MLVWYHKPPKPNVRKSMGVVGELPGMSLIVIAEREVVYVTLATMLRTRAASSLLSKAVMRQPAGHGRCK